MAIAPVYTEEATLDLASVAAMVSALIEIRGYNETPRYACQAWRVNADGTQDNLTQYLSVDNDAQVQFQCTSDVQGSASFRFAIPLVWGADQIQLYQLIRSRAYNAAHLIDRNTWIRFPIGLYVVTTPGFSDLDVTDQYEVEGFDRNYLLQSQPIDAFSFAIASRYGDAVTKVFRTAGLLGGSAALSSICDYDSTWYTKTLPAAMQYTPDQTYLQAVNDLLLQSGARALWVQPTGRWRIDLRPNVPTQAIRWRWGGSDAADPALIAQKAVVKHQTAYSGDVKGAPNQWVFIQSGLSFQPIEGSGQYTVNNVAQPPSGQAFVGRVIRSSQYLTASGQADLKTQGDAIAQAAMMQAEQINLATTPWPVGRNFDVFYFWHEDLPFDPQRVCQAQSWTLPLWGGTMAWQANVVRSP